MNCGRSKPTGDDRKKQILKLLGFHKFCYLFEIRSRMSRRPLRVSGRMLILTASPIIFSLTIVKKPARRVSSRSTDFPAYKCRRVIVVFQYSQRNCNPLDGGSCALGTC